jgi:hypothetical protein
MPAKKRQNPEHVGLTVFVYRNLDKPCFIVKCAQTNKILAHAKYVELADARLVVSEAGRERVLREKRKNIHAGVVGKLVKYAFVVPQTMKLATTVSYDPFKRPYFYDCRTMAPVYTADRLECAKGRCFV